MPKARSQAQAALFGLIASGKKPRGRTGRSSMTQEEARDRLRGVKVSRLPERMGEKKKKGKPKKKKSGRDSRY